MAVLLGKYFPLLPQIVATIWVSLPRVQIPSVYLHELSTLYTQWGQQQGPSCIVHMGHLLSNHHTLADYTLPVNVLNDGSLSVYSSKRRFIPELCTPHHILALGNILSCIGTQVSSVSWVSGRAPSASWHWHLLQLDGGLMPVILYFLYMFKFTQ